MMVVGKKEACLLRWSPATGQRRLTVYQTTSIYGSKVSSTPRRREEQQVKSATTHVPHIAGLVATAYIWARGCPPTQKVHRRHMHKPRAACNASRTLARACQAFATSICRTNVLTACTTRVSKLDLVCPWPVCPRLSPRISDPFGHPQTPEGFQVHGFGGLQQFPHLASHRNSGKTIFMERNKRLLNPN